MSENISKKVQDAIDGIMRNDPTMTSVDLSCRYFNYVVGAAGAAAFAAALEKNSSLQTLDISREFLFILLLFVEIGRF